MLEISLNMYHAVALGAFLFWLGGVITSKISLLNRYCIPGAPGGRPVLLHRELHPLFHGSCLHYL